VQDHGGQIEVLSKPEKGTVITILLPLVDRKARLLKSPRDAQ
jgi:signal transduction histidine kinase